MKNVLGKIWRTVRRIPWYAVMQMDPGGHLDRATWADLGPNLVPDFLAEMRAGSFDRGTYAVLAYIPASRKPLPDWGCLTVRGPGSWVLRSRDGQTVWAAGRQGLPICLRTEGGES
jgi:hypothetical protein